MKKKALQTLLTEFCSSTDNMRVNQIHCLFNDEIEKTCTSVDVDAFQLLLGQILIDNGKRRQTTDIMAMFPVIHMLLGEKSSFRLADWP